MAFNPDQLDTADIRRAGTTAFSINSSTPQRSAAINITNNRRGMDSTPKNVAGPVAFEGLPFSLPKNKSYMRASPLLGSPLHAAIAPSPLMSPMGAPAVAAPSPGKFQLVPGIFSNEPDDDPDAVGFSLDDAPPLSHTAMPAASTVLRRDSLRQMPTAPQSSITVTTKPTIQTEQSTDPQSDHLESTHKTSQSVSRTSMRPSSSSCKDVLLSAVVMSLGFLEAFLLHLYGAALTAYRWCIPLTPSITGLLVSVFAVVRFGCTGRRSCSDMRSLLFQAGIGKLCITAVLQAAGHWLIAVSLPSLPLACTLLLLFVVQHPVLTSGKAGKDYKLRIDGPRACVSFALVASLINAFTGNSIGSVWDEALDSRLSNAAVNAASQPLVISASLLLAGVVVSWAAAFFQQRMLMTRLEHLIDDAYLGPEREREARERAKREASKNAQQPSSRPRSKPASVPKSLQHRKPAVMIIDEADIKAAVLGLSSFLLALLSMASIAFVQGLVANDAISGSAASYVHINDGGASVVTRVQAGISCLFAGGSDVDGQHMIHDKHLLEAISDAQYSYINFCPIVLPAFIGFLCVSAAATCVRQARQLKPQAAFFEAYDQVATEPNPQEKRTQSSSSHKSKRAWYRWNAITPLTFTTLLALIVSAGNPVTQQASPSMLHALVATDFIALALLVVAAVWENRATRHRDEKRKRPPKYPLPPLADVNGRTYTVVGGIQHYEIGID